MIKLVEFNPLDIQNGSFIIPNNVSEINNLLFHNCYQITDIIMEEGMQIIGNSAFWNCTNLKTINIPKTVTEIGFWAFKSCQSLKEIKLDCKLTKIESALFIDCTSLEKVIINCSIEEIEYEAFRNCKRMKKLFLPSSVTKIGENAFNNCLELEEINLPINISELKDACFKNCQKLKQIDIPDKVMQIGDLTFYGCTDLQTVILSKKLKKIGDRCFEGCINLKTITLPNGLKTISSGVFMNSGLTKIDVPSSVISIGENAFNNTNLKSINFSSSLILYNFKELESLTTLKRIAIYGQQINNLTEIKDIQVKELLDKIYGILSKNNHIYNLTRESLNKFYQSNYNFLNIVNFIIYKTTNLDGDYKSELKKFDILFGFTRFINLPSKEIFESLDITITNKYKLKVIKELNNIPLFNKISEARKRMIDVISVFGLFEDDNYAYSRLKKVKQLFEINLNIDEENFHFINYLSSYFEKVLCKEYVLNKYAQIPLEIEEYLKEVMAKEDISTLKKLDKRKGKKANDFFKENYTLQSRIYYRPRTNIDENILNKIYHEILCSRMNNQITVESLNNIFNEIPRIYDPKVSVFLFKNFKYLLSNSSYQKNVKIIIQKYNEIESFYLSKGNINFNFIDASKYIDNYTFSDIKSGNHEFAKLVKNAGVTSQEKFEKYQDLYEKIKHNRESIIPRIKEENIIKLNDINYQIAIETLRKDDPFTMLVGEVKYSDCCQVFGDNAESSMLHACTDGRIFCVYFINNNGNKELLAQSWVWRRGNFICFDNIEFTSFSKSKKICQDIVYECYKLASEKLVEISTLNNDKLEVITIGCGNDDLKLEKYFKDIFENKVGPYNYNGYLDSKRVCYIKGNEHLIDTNYTINKIYLDERKLIKIQGNKISTNLLNKMRIINEELNNFYDFSNLCDENIEIIIGEDWYCIYTIGKCINDLKIGLPKHDEEKDMQVFEIKRIIEYLTRQMIIYPKEENILNDLLPNVYTKKFDI